MISLDPNHEQPANIFYPETHGLTDALARELFKREGHCLGLSIEDHTNEVGVDLFNAKMNRYFEVGIKIKHWDIGSETFGNPRPLPDLSVEIRKIKYLNPEEESEFLKTRHRENLFYCYFSGDLKWYITTNGTSLYHGEKIFRSSDRNPTGEYFIHVPLKYCKIQPVMTEIWDLPSEVTVPYVLHQLKNGKRLWPEIPKSFYDRLLNA